MHFFSLRKLILIIIFQQLIFQSYSTLAQFTSATIEIDRLTTSSRSLKIEKAIRNLDFVKIVKTDLNESTAEVTFTEGSNVSIDELVKKIRQAGFCVKSVSANYFFQTSKVVVYDTIMLNHEVYYCLKIPNDPLVKEVNFRFAGENFQDKDSYREWVPEIEQAKRKYPSLKSAMYFVVL